jgi:hypothetical protein
MTIITPKVATESDFYEINALKTEFPWLNNRRYEMGLLGLLDEYRTTEDRQALKVLFGRFTHHVYDDRLHAVDYLVEVIQAKKFEPINTLFVATSDGNESDGSTSGLYAFKPELAQLGQGWKEENLIPSLELSFDKSESCHVKNVVIFDDFIGSGKTIVKKVNSFTQEMKLRNILNIKVYVFAYVGMKFGIEHAEGELGIEIHCPIKLLKGISEYKSDNQQELTDTILAMESKLAKKWNKLKMQEFSLGYKKSEALYQLFRSNCSNNVFPIFWWPKKSSGEHRVTLFNRLR